LQEKEGHSSRPVEFFSLSLWERVGVRGLSEKIFEMVLSWAKTIVLKGPRRAKLRTLP
jgi:hypothetical protein